MTQLTKRQKILGLFLILIAIGFLGDRFFFLPKTGQAEEETAPVEVVSELKFEIKSLDAKGESSYQLSTKLSELCPEDVNDMNEADLRNPFIIAEKWKETDQQSGEPVSRVTEFQSKHRLLAIISKGQTQMAIIDYETLGLGTELDGFLLVEIQTESVVFADGDLKCVLKLNEE